jgi:hypothetical protein
MADSTEETGLMIKCMARVSSYGQREEATKAIMKET